MEVANAALNTRRLLRGGRSDNRCLQRSPHGTSSIEEHCSVCDRLLRSNLRLGPLHLILLADIRVRYDLSGNCQQGLKEGMLAPLSPHRDWILPVVDDVYSAVWGLGW